MSEVAEKAAETTAEVVEETIDGVVDVVEVVRNNPVTLVLVGVAGLAAGGAGGYFIARKLLRKYYSDLSEVEIAEAKEFYANLYKTSADGAVLTPQEVLSQRHGAAVAADALRTYQGRQATESILEKDEMEVALDEQDEAAVIRLEERARSEHKEYTEEPSETRNVFLDPSFDYEEEVKLRSKEKPYIITHDEYFAAEKDYETQSLTYFEEDDTLVNENDNPVDDLDVIGEDHLARFGHGSKDRNVVYVRNDKLEMDFEIVLAKGSYLEALGLGPEPNELKHNNQRDRRRAFRHGDG